MNDQIKQDEVNKAVWAACDTFRGTVSADVYKDYVLTMLFLKYLSDVWQDHYDEYKKQYGDTPELIAELMTNERFVLPESANFTTLYKARHEPGNGERIDKALHAIEEAIRKALLPRLFGLTGLDKAKVITEKVVEVTRIGLARGSGAKA